jgi:PKD repeat protein
MKASINFIVSCLLLTTCVAWLSSCKKDNTPVTPVVAFEYQSASTLEFGVPLNVTFQDDSKSTDATAKYAWDFGDGSTSTDQNPTHNYSKGGDYTVNLTVTNGSGTKATASHKITLTNLLVGTWKLDSLAPATIDSFATKYNVLTAIEYGAKTGWDGQKWTAADYWGATGYSQFWNDGIFAGNYLGRKAFFAVTYQFTDDGTFTRNENGSLPGVVLFSPEQDSYPETQAWANKAGQSLNDWKSGSYSWTMAASTTYQGRSDLIISPSASGQLGGFVGLYFAGNTSQIPATTYTYTIAQVSATQLIIAGASNLFPGADGSPDPDWFIMKFKKVQ